ncbi:hypothetical protein EC845_2227 [Comamonas sp. BIGb0124]|uniref:ABC-three component system protein n=1 Tax=Comamonas sp. BIGb0124 TaxID=2485130 RepID=UPI000F4814B0|nr:ABC-three component system protein [Comamonas sp. BIGb0124]ROR21410.1 hypothetical protein EC845_2227 [Comamonas sp. BIGb0124]
MTPQEIIDATLVPGTKGVFVLGSFEQRVTVYSQQVRALNLVDALLSLEMVRREGGRIAIVGGGAAGMTAAVALAKAAPRLAQLDLFERRAGVLELQRNSGRFLHPHLYDWPADGATRSKAGLPIMDWHAGSAGAVAKELHRQFTETVAASPLVCFTEHEVVELKSFDVGLVRVFTRNGAATKRIYDAVILAVGFGLERFLGNETASYWSPSELAAPLLAGGAEPTIFVSGNGDGGLVDFLMAAFDSLEHMDICQLLINQDFGEALTELQAIEQEAWAAGADLDLLEQYRARVRSLVPPAVWAEINDRLRRNVRVVLHTREARLLRKTTALHNRFATFLVLDADQTMGHNAISVKVGIDFDGPPPEDGPVVLAGEVPFLPFKRVLRLGPDVPANLSPFASLLSGYAAKVAVLHSATRPESPTLTATASALFEPFRVANGAEVVAHAFEEVRPATLNLVVSHVAAGRVNWSGGIGPDMIAACWAPGSVVALHCSVSAIDAGRLVHAFARLGAHAPGITLFVRDAVRWRSALDALWQEPTHPGPGLQFRCAVEQWRDPPALEPLVEIPIADLAETINDRLDAETLRELHGTLFDILGPPALATGWLIEQALRQRLLELWQAWFDTLTADSSKRRRFLRLLANASDKMEADYTSLVGVGLRTVSPHLTLPTIFGLAFATCSGRAVEPAMQHPGNVAIDMLTGHACGVEWINKRTVRGSTVGMQTWTTTVVLLSQLGETVQMMEGDVRLDQEVTDPPKVGVPSLSERPIVIGADDAFLSAMEEGSPAVQQFFEAVFQRRADAARQSLQEVDDGKL